MIVIILLVVFFMVFMYLLLRKPSEKNEDDNIAKLTEKINKIGTRLSHIHCQDQNSIQDMIDGRKINDQATTLMQSSDPPSPSSVLAYTNAYSALGVVYGKVLLLPQCTCPQGTTTGDGICNCPTGYSYPVAVNGITYCSNRACSGGAHSKFTPSDGSDPSKNLCACDSNYSMDSLSDPNCYNTANTAQMATFTQQINQKNDDLTQYL